MLLAGWLAELPLCPTAYRLDEAIYRSRHYGLKYTTSLQWPIKDKGCHIFGRSGALRSLTVALESVVSSAKKKGNCSVG